VSLARKAATGKGDHSQRVPTRAAFGRFALVRPLKARLHGITRNVRRAAFGAGHLLEAVPLDNQALKAVADEEQDRRNCNLRMNMVAARAMMPAITNIRGSAS
jgi:hypothetical protein